MKKFFAVLALLCLPGAAYGADLPIKAPLYSAAPAWSWTGFYAGGSVGYGWSSVNHEQLSTNANGVLGGIYVGYNWQLTNLWVVGAETDIAWANIKGSSDITGKVGTVPFATHVEDQTHWLGTTRARIGVTPWQSVLLYGTAGVAYGNVESTLSSCVGCSSLSSSFATSESQSTTKAGWAAGAGIDWAVTNNLIARAEYLHYDLGTVALFNNAATKYDGNLVRAGLAWKF